MKQPAQQLSYKLLNHLQNVYADVKLDNSLEEVADTLITIMRLDKVCQDPIPHQNKWDQRDIVMITYGDSIKNDQEKPLHTLLDFLREYCSDIISGVHILPFFPYSSDDGFAVINYSSVNETLGNWDDIQAIADEYRLMSDLVINHCSSRSLWFENFKKDIAPGKDFFYTADINDDISAVTRPRTSSLLRETETVNGTRHVWCTFSHDQVDFDFQNPDVLIEFVKIIRLYLDNGVRIFRLDAVAFLWKQLGSQCINLPQTHETIRLLRTLIEHTQDDAIIITETNIPNHENLTYLGNANEAHSIYNFSLPPLLLNTLVTGNCSYLKQWLMSMPPAQNGTTYFNFIASHDGIGLRPAEGLLNEKEIDTLVETMHNFGGHISLRAGNDGKPKPYEINISLYDALQGTIHGTDQYQEDRFICAHAIMLALEGIPAFYIHSLVASENDYERLKHTNHNRAINRRQWNYKKLTELLDNPKSHHQTIFLRLKELIKLRISQSAFHPNATQFTLHLGNEVFGCWRQSLDRKQSIFCIYNISNTTQDISLSEINLISTDKWKDLISNTEFSNAQETITLMPYQAMWITNIY